MPHLKFSWLFGKGDTESPQPNVETKIQKITIADEVCEVTAHMTDKATWKAYGYVKGTPVHTCENTAPATFSRWRVMAKTLASR